MADTLAFTTAQQGEWGILAAQGRIDTMTAPQAQETAMAFLQENTKMAMEMSELNYISSAGLRVLLQLAKKAKAENKSFALVGPSGLVQEVLEESGMDALFTICASVDALA